MNRRYELIICMLVLIQESQKLFKIYLEIILSYFRSCFWVSIVKNGRGNLVHETLKSAVS